MHSWHRRFKHHQNSTRRPPEKTSENGSCPAEEGSRGGSPKAGVPKSGVPKGGEPNCWAPKGGGPEGWEPKISCFSFPRPPLFSFFLPLLGVVSWNFGGVIQGRDAQMCTFGVLGLSCEAPAAPKPLGFYTTAPRAPCTVGTDASNTTKILREEPQRETKSENGSGRVKKKKSEILGGPAEGWRESRRRRSGGERPNFGRTLENFEHTPHRHTTQHNGGSRTGWSWERGFLAGRSVAQKTRHEQQIVPKSSPSGQGFLGSRMVRKGLGTKRFDQKKGAKRRSGPKVVWAKSGAGQKLSQKPKNMEKQIKNKNIPLPSTQNKEKKKSKKSKNQQQNQKMKKCLKKIKSNIAQTRKKSKNQFFLLSLLFYFFIFCDLCDVL